MVVTYVNVDIHSVCLCCLKSRLLSVLYTNCSPTNNYILICFYLCSFVYYDVR